MCDGLARPELLRSTRRYRQGRREANLGPKEPSIDPLEHVGVCRGRVFACSKGAMNASQSKSCREPVRGEMRELGGADVVAASLEGRIAIVRAGSARAGRQPYVLGALEVSSFAMHSNQQRCERSDDFRDGWPKLPGHPCAMVWHAQSSCGRVGGTARGDEKPT